MTKHKSINADTVPADGGSKQHAHSLLTGKKTTTLNHKTKMAVQETASQLSMALKVQEYPTLKVKTSDGHVVITSRWCYRSTQHTTSAVIN